MGPSRLPAAMRTPRLPLLVPVLLVLLAALAGCASQETGSEDLPPISAREALEEARPTLEEWDEDAELLIASGFEGGPESPALQREQREAEQGVDQGFPVHEDTLAGDGRAPQWVLVVLAEDRTRTLRASAEEVAWMDEGARQAGPGARPVGNWTIDSTDAVEHAREASDGLDEILAARDVSVFLTLSETRRGPQWQLQATSHTVAEQRTLFVDAQTGEVSNRTDMQTRQRTETYEGSLEGPDDGATHPVQISSQGARVAVELTWNLSAGQEGVRLSAALAANGTTLDAANSEQRVDRFQARWDRLDPDDYQVQIRVDEWADNRSVAYELNVHVAE